MPHISRGRHQTQHRGAQVPWTHQMGAGRDVEKLQRLAATLGASGAPSAPRGETVCWCARSPPKKLRYRKITPTKSSQLANTCQVPTTHQFRPCAHCKRNRVLTNDSPIPSLHTLENGTGFIPTWQLDTSPMVALLMKLSMRRTSTGPTAWRSLSMSKVSTWWWRLTTGMSVPPPQHDRRMFVRACGTPVGTTRKT